MTTDRDNFDGFVCHNLDDRHTVYEGSVPTELLPDTEGFERLWCLHPEAYQQIKIHGRLVNTPRWQQAYGIDYHYSAQVNKALPVPARLRPILVWCQTAIDGRLNGLLLNWYDGARKHYIGRHRDSIKHMIDGAPTVTISFGETRTFRLRPWKGQGRLDFTATPGVVFIMPYETNLAWTHEVPHSTNCRGRRVSVTVRAFKS